MNSLLFKSIWESIKSNFTISILLLTGIVLSCKKEIVTEAPKITDTWQIQWVNVNQEQIVDEKARTLQLRGINVRVNGLFDVEHSDGRRANEIIPEITQRDIQDIAKMGFNFVRLPINWSGYEPEKDQFSTTYLNRIKEVVSWCKQENLYVQLDWHFDAYSKEIGEDGAPYWAVLPTIFPKVEGILDFNQLFLLRANPFCFLAYRNFFGNTSGIQDEFFTCWTNIIEAFKDENAIIGFEPMNEPICYAAGMSDAVFMDFYKKCSQKMRAIDTRHLLWLEPDAIRNFLNFSPLPTQQFPDTKIVYCPHYYPNLTAGASYNQVAGWKSNMKTPMDRIVEEAHAWHAPVCLNEWGINPSTVPGKAYIPAMREMAEARNIHQAFWVWKEPLPGTSGKDGNWGFYDHISGNNQWTERTVVKKDFAVPYVMAMPGIMQSHYFNTSTRELKCTFLTNDSEYGPVVYINPDWYPDGYSVYVNGIKTGTEADTYHRVSIAWSSANSGGILLEVKPD